MNHRKRNAMQHKIELSTMLKIAMAKNKKRHSLQSKITDNALVTMLATQAIESVKNCDTSLVNNDSKKKRRLEKAEIW